jgi:hypothetical protein
MAISQIIDQAAGIIENPAKIEKNIPMPLANPKMKVIINTRTEIVQATFFRFSRSKFICNQPFIIESAQNSFASYESYWLHGSPELNKSPVMKLETIATMKNNTTPQNNTLKIVM